MFVSLPQHVCQLHLPSFFPCILLNKLSKNFLALSDMFGNDFPESFYCSSLLVFFMKHLKIFQIFFVTEYILIFTIIHVIKRFPKGCSHFTNCSSVSVLDFDQVSSVSIVDCEKVNVCWVKSFVELHKNLWNGTYKDLNCMYVVFSIFGRVSLKHILLFRT